MIVLCLAVFMLLASYFIVSRETFIFKIDILVWQSYRNYIKYSEIIIVLSLLDELLKGKRK